MIQETCLGSFNSLDLLSFQTASEDDEDDDDDDDDAAFNIK
jgi:hypothetical protein